MGWAVRTLLVLFLFACATPQATPPAFDPEVSSATEARLLETAMTLALQRRARVYDLAWPVLVANADLCPKTAPRAGLVLADRKLLARMAGGAEEAALERGGVPEGLRVVHAFAGSPAAEAGVPAGAMVESVNGEPEDDPAAAARAIKERLEAGEEATITAGGTTYAFSGETACEAAVKISTSQGLNANAVSGITINTGLIRSLDDQALQAIIAHELAHIALDHPREYARNALVTGAPVTGPVVYGAASTTDRLLRLIGRAPDRSLTGRALAVLAPWSDAFEAEADYVGLYMHARAGGDARAAIRAFEVMGQEGPKSLTVRATHPLIPERVAAAEAALAEIDAKRAADEALVPEGLGGSAP